MFIPMTEARARMHMNGDHTQSLVALSASDITHCSTLFGSRVSKP